MTHSSPSRDDLRAHLVTARIAGDVATTRQNNLENFDRCSRREPLFLFGLEPAGRWSAEDVLELMVKRCGVVADPGHRTGPDTIDPDLTLDRLEAMAERVGQAARRRERVLVATGHPYGLQPVHTAVAAALRTAGATLLTPAAGWRHPPGPFGAEGDQLRYVDDVAVLSAPDAAWRREVRLHHTHSPEPMRAALAALAQAGEPPPDLVFADHGWAGAAGQAGVDAVGFADCNDPALFIGEAEGQVLVSVPLDDNVAPHLYDPLIAYLLAGAGLLPPAGAVGEAGPAGAAGGASRG